MTDDLRRADRSVQVFSRHWTGLSDTLDAREWVANHRARRAEFYALLEHCLPSPSRATTRVLEVGCGTGIDSYVLAASMAGRVVASDASWSALQLSQKMGREFPGVSLLWLTSDARRLACADRSFDVVFSQGVLEHFKDPLTVLREQARVVVPGGRVVVSVPQTFHVYSLYKQGLQLIGRWPYGWETQFSARALAALGRQAGLTVERFQGIGWADEFLMSRQSWVRAAAKGYAWILRSVSRVIPNWKPYLTQDVVVVFRR